MIDDMRIYAWVDGQRLKLTKTEVGPRVLACELIRLAGGSGRVAVGLHPTPEKDCIFLWVDAGEIFCNIIPRKLLSLPLDVFSFIVLKPIICAFGGKLKRKWPAEDVSPFLDLVSVVDR